MVSGVCIPTRERGNEKIGDIWIRPSIGAIPAGVAMLEKKVSKLNHLLDLDALWQAICEPFVDQVCPVFPRYFMFLTDLDDICVAELIGAGRNIVGAAR